jgi:hypothetical protein
MTTKPKPSRTGSTSLYNTDRWKDKNGDVRLLIEMDLSYCENLLAFLERNAQRLMWNDYLRFENDATFHDGGEMAQNTLERIADELRRDYRDGKWDEWLAEMPFVIALKAEIKRTQKNLRKQEKKLMKQLDQVIDNG